MKITLTPEESRELIRRGIDEDKASLYEPQANTNPGGFGGQVMMGCPIFTLTDLLSILPKEFEDHFLTIIANNSTWDITYDDFQKDPIFVSSNNELINSLYTAILWTMNHSSL